MELKKFIENIKSIKTTRNSLLNLTYDILNLEESLIEINNKTHEINLLGELLKSSFIIISENKIQVNNKDKKDLDLDNWKNSIKKYALKNKVDKYIYLYALRVSLKNLIKAIDELNTENIKIYIFELIIKTFLYIDSIDLSIDHILQIKSDQIKLSLEVLKKVDENENK